MQPTSPENRLHRPVLGTRLGPDHPLDELVSLLNDAIRAGKVLHIGISNTPAWAVARANALAEATGRARFAAIQIEYNLTERTAERELLPMGQHLGLSTLAWGPLAGGLLSGKYRPTARDRAEPRRLLLDDHRLTERNLTITDEVVSVADELDITPPAVALAWLCAQPARPIPIIGARTAAQLNQTLLCLTCSCHNALSSDWRRKRRRAGLPARVPRPRSRELHASAGRARGEPSDRVMTQ